MPIILLQSLFFKYTYFYIRDAYQYELEKEYDDLVAMELKLEAIIAALDDDEEEEVKAAFGQEPTDPKWTGCTGTKLKPSQWMCQLQSAMTSSPKINTLNIAGTHDSAAKKGKDIDDRDVPLDAVCHYQSIKQQLEMGYRYFDLRIIYDPNGKQGGEFYFVHYDNKFLSWSALHEELKSFRSATGGTECIILSIKNEMGKENYWKKPFYPNRELTANDFAVPLIKRLKEYQSGPPEDRIYYVGHTEAPTLKECKGRVVFQAKKGKKGAAEWHKGEAWATFEYVCFYGYYTKICNDIGILL